MVMRNTNKSTAKVSRKTTANKVNIAALFDEMPANVQTAVVTLFTALVKDAHADDMGDLEPATRSRRGRAAKVADEKPARGRRGRPAKDDDEEEEDEDEAPKTTRRRGRSSGPKLSDEPTYDELLEFIGEIEVEPVSGGIRELKPKVEEWGADYDALVAEEDTRAGKILEAGTFIAAMEVALKALVKVPADALTALAEEVGAEKQEGRASLVAKSILIAINSMDEDGEEGDDDENDDDENEDGEEGDEDEDGEEGDDDNLDDIEDDEEENTDDDDDLVDLDPGPKARRSRR